MTEEHIRNYVHSQEWHIDSNYGLRELTQFLFNISLHAKGVETDELGFAEQRAQSRSISILDPDTGKTVTEAMGVNKVPDNREYIAKMQYSGVMRMEDGLCSIGIKTFSDQLYEVSQLENISGVMVYMDTGGGVVTAGNIMNAVVSDIKKPVAFVSPFLGSAGYMAAAPATLIIGLGRNSQFGSIGTFLTVNTKFWEEYQANYEDIYSSLSVDKNKVVRAIKEGDTETVVNYLDDHTKEFHKMVLNGRGDKIRTDTKDETLRGGMFPAFSARRRGLIDGIGGYNYALRRLKSAIRIYQNS